MEGAISEYSAAIRLTPGHADAHSGLGLALQDKGDLEGAIAEYRTVIRIEPDSAYPHYFLGLALKAEGRRAEAVQEFHEYLKLAPDTPKYRHSNERAQVFLRELE